MINTSSQWNVSHTFQQIEHFNKEVYVSSNHHHKKINLKRDHLKIYILTASNSAVGMEVY